MSDSGNEKTLADDLLHGAVAIGEFVGLKERPARWKIATGAIPTKRMGRNIVGSKTELRQLFAPHTVA